MKIIKKRTEEILMKWKEKENNDHNESANQEMFEKCSMMTVRN